MLKKIKRACSALRRRIEDPISYSRKVGVTIGNECKLNGMPNWGSEPYLISLGNHVEISFDCVFITHDGATWVFRNRMRQIPSAYSFSKNRNRQELCAN